MNLFQKYGIKEVADVTFYSIIEISDEELYIPVLFLDTLKISNINQNSNKISHNGDYGNQPIIAWQSNKKFTLSIEDALFTPASMSMTLGWLNNKITKYIGLIKKINIVNKYYKNNYSIYAFPSPQLTEDEQELLFNTITEIYKENKMNYTFKKQDFDVAKNCERRHDIKEIYYKRNKIDYQTNYEIILEEDRDDGTRENLFNSNVITKIFGKINEVKDFNSIDSSYYNLQTLDRMEKCYVTQDEGFTINIKQQIENLQRYYNNEKTNFTIFYDEKTMQPLALFDKKFSSTENIDSQFILKKGTVYYKWSRTIQPILNDVSFLGKSLVIDGNTFPDKYKIVGETYIREQNTSKDQRFQFIIPCAAVSSEQKIELRADGGPSIFSMNIDVLKKDNHPEIELRQFNVDKDIVNGGTYIVPQSVQYTHTPILIDNYFGGTIENNVIY